MSGIQTASRLLATKQFKRAAAVFGILVLVIAALIMRHYQRVRWEKDHVYVQARPIQTALGWGYEIVVSDTVFIHQEFIPAISGRHGFRSSEDAMKVARKIINNMKHGKVEAVSVRDLKDLGIIDSLPSTALPTVHRPDTVERMRLPH